MELDYGDHDLDGQHHEGDQDADGGDYGHDHDVQMREELHGTGRNGFDIGHEAGDHLDPGNHDLGGRGGEGGQRQPPATGLQPKGCKAIDDGLGERWPLGDQKDKEADQQDLADQ